MELGIYTCSYKIFTHESIPINHSANSDLLSKKYESSEEKYKKILSSNFKKEIVLLNLSNNYYNQKKYEEADQILISLLKSNFLYLEGYVLQGFNYFDWGKSLMDNKNCTYTETEPLWKIANKKFTIASYLSILRISYSDYKKYIKLRNDVSFFINNLPKWKKECLKKQMENSNSESQENQSSSDSRLNSNKKDPKKSSKNSKNENSPNMENNEKTETEETKSQKDKTSEFIPSELAKLQKLKKSLEEKRLNASKNLSLSEKEKGTLKEAQNKLQENTFSEGEYRRFMEEIPIIRDEDELERLMKQGKW